MIVSENIIGHVDVVNLKAIKGWVADKNAPDKAVNVGLYLEGRLIIEVPAEGERPDLTKVGLNNIEHGFDIDIRALGINSLQLSKVQVLAGDSKVLLKGKTYTMSEFELNQSKMKANSVFGGNWIDDVKGDQIIKQKLDAGEITEEDAENLKSFITNGYIVLKNAVPEDVIDKIVDDVEAIWDGSLPGCTIETFEPDGIRKYIPVTNEYRDGVTKLLDIYQVSLAAQQAVLSEKVSHFVKTVFDAKPWAFQSLSFWHGSEQKIHKDTVSVKVHPPMSLVASWIALEDIKPGSGELQYYRGSHKSPDYLFAGQNKWSDGNKDEYEKYYASLHSDAEKYSQPLERFLGNKGDVLIWHADLAHGGSPVTDPTLTRKSLVTHYCSERSVPHYYYENKTQKKEVNGGILTSHYGSIK